MTGFARVRKSVENAEITVSLKSVNHRGLDMHFHLPSEFDALENDIRTALKNGLARGHVQIHISYVRAAAQVETPFNRALLDSYIRAFREAAATYQLRGEPDLNALLRIPGVLSAVAVAEDIPAEVSTAVLELTAEALTMLNAFREREGAATARELRQRCENICGLVERMEQIRQGAIPAFLKRLRDKLADLLHGVGIDPPTPRPGSRHSGRPQRHCGRTSPPPYPFRTTAIHAKSRRRSRQTPRLPPTGDEPRIKHHPLQNRRPRRPRPDHHRTGPLREIRDRQNPRTKPEPGVSVNPFFDAKTQSRRDSRRVQTEKLSAYLCVSASQRRKKVSG